MPHLSWPAFKILFLSSTAPIPKPPDPGLPDPVPFAPSPPFASPTPEGSPRLSHRRSHQCWGAFISTYGHWWPKSRTQLSKAQTAVFQHYSGLLAKTPCKTMELRNTKAQKWGHQPQKRGLPCVHPWGHIAVGLCGGRCGQACFLCSQQNIGRRVARRANTPPKPTLFRTPDLLSQTG